MDNIKSYKLKNKLIVYPKHDILYNYYIRYNGGIPPKSIPNLVYSIFEFYNTKTSNGGYSEDIAKYVHSRYIKYNKHLGIRNITNSKLQFTIISWENYEDYEPVRGMGTYTAVYEIYDINNNINDNEDKIYILRIYDRQYSINMYNSPKVKNEYTLFSQYMSKIYYYGEIQQEYKTIFYYPKKLETYDYTITKKYNTPLFNDAGSIVNLTNLQKFKFLLNNLDMLNTLQEQKYIHLDYKITNVAWEDSNTMNVILIDYDHDTLFKTDGDDDLFELITDPDNNYENYRIKYSSTLVPNYIMSNYTSKIPPYKLDKYSMAGFENLYKNLNIKFISEIIDNIDPPIKVNNYITIRQIIPDTLTLHLEMNSSDYELIPNYAQLLNFFLNLGISGFIKDVKKEDLL